VGPNEALGIRTWIQREYHRLGKLAGASVSLVARRLAIAWYGRLAG